MDNDNYYHLSDEDVKKCLFSSELVNYIMVYEKSVELVGIVSDTEIRQNLMKFTVNNRNNNIIQVLVWENDIINSIRKIVIPGNIIHIDGAFARPRHDSLSQGNIKFDLNIMSNTLIRLIKVTPDYISTRSIGNIPTVTIEDCVKMSGIQIVAYLKNPIRENSYPTGKVNEGCLSDCLLYKLSIICPDLCDMSNFKVGSHVRVTGIIKYFNNPYLWFPQRDCITSESDKTTKMSNLLKGTKMPKRIKTESPYSPPNKK